MQLLRDLHTLKQRHAQAPAVIAWAQAGRAHYAAAQAWRQPSGPGTLAARTTGYARCGERACQVGQQYARVRKQPCAALAKRLRRQQAELFQFVLLDGRNPDNNLAERCLRPLVVLRKLRGGTRSPQGSQTRMALASLFGTWQARGLNPFDECLKLLHQTPVPQI